MLCQEALLWQAGGSRVPCGRPPAFRPVPLLHPLPGRASIAVAEVALWNDIGYCRVNRENP